MTLSRDGDQRSDRGAWVGAGAGAGAGGAVRCWAGLSWARVIEGGGNGAGEVNNHIRGNRYSGHQVHEAFMTVP